jgi:hypothetical protein
VARPRVACYVTVRQLVTNKPGPSNGGEEVHSNGASSLLMIEIH